MAVDLKILLIFIDVRDSPREVVVSSIVYTESVDGSDQGGGGPVTDSGAGDQTAHLQGHRE